MAIRDVQGFQFNVGIAGVFSNVSEIARRNLPGTSELMPAGSVPTTQVYGQLTDSAIRERLEHFLEPDIRNRELQLPSVFAAVLSRLLGKLNRATTASEKEKALAECLQALEDDKELCDTFRNLLIGG